MFKFSLSSPSIGLNLLASWNIFQTSVRSISRKSFPNCILHPKVEEALQSSLPVVALESAIITHGMPRPFNLQTALSVEAIIREEGAIPATIGVIDGNIHVGLTEDQISFLAECKKNCFKVSRRDFPYVLAKKFQGGTTVSGTMLVAHLVGIPLFVTGGIGGVHRGGEETLDVSADLTELGKTPVAVVSAGVKSILDVGRTLEYLETQGVCVASLSNSKAFPDFFTKDSGFESPYNVRDCLEAAQMMLKRKEMNLDTGILFAVPVPVHEEGDGLVIQKAIDQALSEAAETVRGRDVTPFVLRRVSEITEMKSLWTNMALVKNNARHGARIAVEYCRLVNHDQRRPAKRKEHLEGKIPPVVIGGSIADSIVKIEEEKMEFNGRSHRGKLSQNFGGVGRNIADALTRLRTRPLFVSAVGKDAPGAAILNHNPEMDTGGIRESSDTPTAAYSVLLDHKGEALIGVGDMDAHEAISSAWVAEFEAEIERSPLLILDGNVPAATMETVFEICAKGKVPVWYEPTDLKKALKPWNLSSAVTPSFASPNLGEFNAVIQHLSQGTSEEIVPRENEDLFMKQILSACQTHLSSMRGIMVTFGHKGFMIVRWSKSGEEDSPLLQEPSGGDSEGKSMVGLHFPVQTTTPIASVSGAGDCLASGFITGMLQHKTVSECAFIGLTSADLSLQASEAVPRSLSRVPTDSEDKFPYKLIHS